MTANEAMLVVAQKLAQKWGYIETKIFDIDAEKDSFWGNQCIGIQAYVEKKPPVIVHACKYIFPVFDFEKEEGKRPPRIEIDMHFGNPRLSVRKVDETFACLTYNDGVYSEGQAFKDGGPELLIELKKTIDELIK